MIKCVLLCAGASERYGEDKMKARIGDKTIAGRALEKILSANVFDEIIVVRRRGDAELEKMLGNALVRFADGGSSRFMSVYNGLKACKNCDVVLIHDGARCFVSEKLIETCVNVAKKFGSGVAAVPMTDTVRERDGEFFGKTLDRSKLLKVQTPQAFSYAEIMAAYEKAYAKYGESAPYTDDSEVFSDFIGKCRFCFGEESNVKITYKKDLRAIPLFGIGYDIHRLTKGEGVVLCGEKIPCELSAIAHSDGDVPVHALMDAMLSAAGKRDIGFYFPDTDKRYRRISSLELLKEVKDIIAADGLKAESVTVAVVCERPKLSPHVEAMKENLSEILGISKEKIGITVTTNEGVGAIGINEAIASYATAVLIGR